MKRLVKEALAVCMVVAVLCGCESIMNNDDDETPAVAGTWVIIDEGGSKGLTYIFGADYSLTGTAIDAVNNLLIAFGGQAGTYQYSGVKITMNGSEIGNYVLSGDSLTLNWTTSGNVEHCIPQEN